MTFPFFCVLTNPIVFIFMVILIAVIQYYYILIVFKLFRFSQIWFKIERSFKYTAFFVSIFLTQIDQNLFEINNILLFNKGIISLKSKSFVWPLTLFAGAVPRTGLRGQPSLLWHPTAQDAEKQYSDPPSVPVQVWLIYIYKDVF